MTTRVFVLLYGCWILTGAGVGLAARLDVEAGVEVELKYLDTTDASLHQIGRAVRASLLRVDGLHTYLRGPSLLRLRQRRHRRLILDLTMQLDDVDPTDRLEIVDRSTGTTRPLGSLTASRIGLRIPLSGRDIDLELRPSSPRVRYRVLHAALQASPGPSPAFACRVIPGPRLRSNGCEIVLGAGWHLGSENRATDAEGVLYSRQRGNFEILPARPGHYRVRLPVHKALRSYSAPRILVRGVRVRSTLDGGMLEFLATFGRGAGADIVTLVLPEQLSSPAAAGTSADVRGLGYAVDFDRLQLQEVR